MAKKKIKEKKDKEIRATLIREAKLMGYKEDDPLVKESLEKLLEVKGSSIGRRKMLYERLLILCKNIEKQLEDEKINDLENKVEEVANEEIVNEEVTNEEVTNEEVTNEEVANEEVANEEVANEEVANEEVANEEVAKNIDLDEATINMIQNLANELSEDSKKQLFAKLDEILSQVKSGQVIVINNYIEKPSLASKIYGSAKETVKSTKEAVNSKISEAKEAVNSKISEAKEAVNSKVSETKEAVNSKISEAKETTKKGLKKALSFGTKFKKNVIEQKNKQINNVLTFFEKSKDKTIETKDKAKNKINGYFADRAIKKAMALAQYKNTLIEQAKFMAAAYRIDFENEGMKSKISYEIDRIFENENLGKEKDVTKFVMGKIEDLYKNYNIAVMESQQEKTKESKSYEKQTQQEQTKEKQVDQPEVDQTEVEMNDDFDIPDIEDIGVEQPEVERNDDFDIPDIEDIEVEQPEVERNDDFDASNIEDIGVEQPEVEQPEVEQPEVEQPEVEQNEVEQPEAEPLKIEDIHQFLLGNEKTGYWYYETPDGGANRVFMSNGAPKTLKKVSREEFEAKRKEFVEQEREKQNVADKTQENEHDKKVDMDMENGM